MFSIWLRLNLGAYCILRLRKSFFSLKKTVRDKEYKAHQVKLDRLEKLCRALQTERNELRDTVEFLKQEASSKVAGGDPAPVAPQSCAVLASSKELNTASNSNPGVPTEAAPKGAKEKPAPYKATSPGAGPAIKSVD